MDVADNHSFAYRAPQGEVVAQPGPLDTELVKRWLRTVLEDEALKGELQPHAIAIHEVVDFATRRGPYNYDPTNVVKGRHAPSKGRMAKVLATTISQNDSKNFKDHPFKDWVGTQNVNIEEDKPIVPIGAAVMLGTFFLGYWGIRWVSRYRSKASTVLNEVTSSVA